VLSIHSRFKLNSGLLFTPGSTEVIGAVSKVAAVTTPTVVGKSRKVLPLVVY
jgi:hypothetical protein